MEDEFSAKYLANPSTQDYYRMLQLSMEDIRIDLKNCDFDSCIEMSELLISRSVDLSKSKTKLFCPIIYIMLSR